MTHISSHDDSNDWWLRGMTGLLQGMTQTSFEVILTIFVQVIDQLRQSTKEKQQQQKQQQQHQKQQQQQQNSPLLLGRRRSFGSHASKKTPTWFSTSAVNIHWPWTTTSYILFPWTHHVTISVAWSFTSTLSQFLSTETLSSVLNTRNIVSVSSAMPWASPWWIFTQINKSFWKYSSSIVYKTAKMFSALALNWSPCVTWISKTEIPFSHNVTDKNFEK